MTGHTHDFDDPITFDFKPPGYRVSHCACGLTLEEDGGRTRLRWPGQDWLRIDPAMLRVVCAPPVSLVNVERP